MNFAEAGFDRPSFIIMSKFYLPSTSPSNTSTPAQRTSSDIYSSEDEDTLPYPTELPRSDFLAADFNAATYLSSLRNRHQTLEDLRSDLRQRSQLLNKELIDLVNSNYEEFLSLGGDLKGGEEKVEGLKVGLLGFEREVEGIQRAVKEREAEVRGLLEERKGVRKEVVLGRALLEVGERVTELEESLGLGEKDDDVEGEQDGFDEDEDDGADEGVPGLRLGKLKRHVREYVLLSRAIERIGPEHSFLDAHRGRVAEIRKTLLLDLATGLRAAKNAKEPEAILAIIKMYGDLGAEKESVRVLKGG